jgi:hypothetical protein
MSWMGVKIQIWRAVIARGATRDDFVLLIKLVAHQFNTHRKTIGANFSLHLLRERLQFDLQCQPKSPPAISTRTYH